MNDSGSWLTADQIRLVSMLRLALRDDGKVQRAIDDALRRARMASLPTGSRDLLTFVDTHLVVSLAEELGATIATAFVGAFTADTELQSAPRRPGPPTRPAPVAASNQHTTTTAPPPRSAETPARHDSKGASVPPRRRSMTDLVRTASTRIRAIISSATHRGGMPRKAPRSRVVLIEPDRLVRSSLARALLSARFEVSVFDDSSAALGALGGLPEETVVITDIRDESAGAGLRAMAAASPDLPVIVWTSVARNAVDRVLVALGLTRFVVVSKGAALVEVIDAIRRVLDDRV